MLKKVLLVAVAMQLTACASTDQSMTQKVMKPLIKSQCASELNDSKLWKMTSLVLDASEKQRLQGEICECVGENALNDVPAKDVAHAMVDEDAKKVLVKQAVVNSLKACVLEAK